jgi:hypothetical protein
MSVESEPMVSPTNPDVITVDGVQWMLLAAALPLFPSNAPGKRIHINTVHRMIQQGRLSGRSRRQGQRKVWYVRRDEVLALSQLELPADRPTPPAAQRREAERFTESVLERMRPKGRRK